LFSSIFVFCLLKVNGYGFGIAVSGGRDNPHFKSGDTSIAVSDVLQSGPALGLLQVNDRIVFANGVSLENVHYNTAVQIMKDCDHMDLIVKRRVPIPVLEYDQRTLKFTLTKSRKKDDFGIVLGCKFYIKNITNAKLVEKEPGLKEGDVVLKINGESCDQLTLADARKMLEKSRDCISLIVQRDVPRGTKWRWPSQTPQFIAECKQKIHGLLSDTPIHSPTPRHIWTFDRKLSRTTCPCPVTKITNSCVCVATNSFAGPSSSRTVTPSDARVVSFNKEGGSVGIRVIGGNEVGIFVSAVQPDSPAALKGVKQGDKILRVNNKGMIAVTREEAVLFLLALQDQVEMLLQYKKEEYDYIRSQNIGDSFFIRTHFNCDKPENGDLAFSKGDIFQVTDTLFGGTVGKWQVVRVSSPSSGSKAEVNPCKGVIPNATSTAARRWLLKIDMKITKHKTSTLMRRKITNGRRSKSLTKAHWDEVVFSHGTVKFPPYERVRLRHPGFRRPVIIYGGLSDIAREKLLQDPSRDFAAASGIVRLKNIREVRAVMNKNKHCILDVTPSSVEKLLYAQYCPIVVFLKVDGRSRLRELRKKHSKIAASKSCSKISDVAAKIQKSYGYLFTAVLDATHEDHWFEALRELIAHLQERRVWMSEMKPTDLLDDDFLTPSIIHYELTKHANKVGSHVQAASGLASSTDKQLTFSNEEPGGALLSSCWKCLAPLSRLYWIRWTWSGFIDTTSPLHRLIIIAMPFH
uniref:Tight junction protein 1b n=1 Tax=Soboliphyme baturini TaxID=241478 RepID=A0A183IH14_9BILA